MITLLWTEIILPFFQSFENIPWSKDYSDRYYQGFTIVLQ